MPTCSHSLRILLALVASLVHLALSSSASAQSVNGPPSIYWNVGGSPFDATRPVEIIYCDEEGLGATWQVKWNGVDVTSSFTRSLTTYGTCAYAAHATGTISTNFGSGILWSKICDAIVRTAEPPGPNCTVDSVNVVRRDVDVTSPTALVYRSPNRIQQVPFTVTNKGGSTATFNLTASCSGTGLNTSAGGCSAPASVTLGANASTTVQATFSTLAQGTQGYVSLKATNAALLASADSEPVLVYVDYGDRITVRTDYTGGVARHLERCAASCFDATATVGTPAYYSGDAAQSVELRYRGDLARPQPFIIADLTKVADSPGVSGVTLEAKIWTTSTSSQNITFTNGEQKLFFSAGDLATGTSRIGGQFDAISNGITVTGVYKVDVAVITSFVGEPEHTESDTLHVPITIVNEASSPIAKGWVIGGLQRLYVDPAGNVVITEGSEGATTFSPHGYDAGYYNVPGDFTTLVKSGTADSTWVRAYADSTKAYFNNVGSLTRIVDRFRSTITFTYDASNRLTRISDPYRAGYFTQLTYNSTFGLDSIQELRTASGGGGRSVKVTLNGDGTLQAFRDPDGKQTRFIYDTRGRLLKQINRRGDTTTFRYFSDSSNRVVGILSPKVNVLANGVARDTSLLTSLQPWQTIATPSGRTDTLATPAGTRVAPVLVANLEARVTDPGGHVTRFTTDRWGQPLRTTDPVGNVTTVVRDGNGFPVQVTTPTNLSTTFTYSGQLLTSTTEPDGTLANYHYGAYAQLDSVWGTVVPQRIYLGAFGRVDSVKVGRTVKAYNVWDTVGVYRVKRVRGDNLLFTDYTYDPVTGNQDSVKTPEGRGSKTIFDQYGRAWIHRAAGKADTTVFDAINRVASVRDGVNANATTWEYDNLFLTRITDPKGQKYQVDRNALGWVTRRYDPYVTATDSLAAKHIDAQYDVDGNVVTAKNRRGTTLFLRYDALHRLIGRTDTTSASGFSDSLAYSANGLISTAWNSVSRDSIRVDASGLSAVVVSWMNGRRFSWTRGLDDRGRLTTLDFTGSPGGLRFRRYMFNPITDQLDSLQFGSQWLYQLAGRASPDSVLIFPGVTRKLTRTGDGLVNGVSFSVAAVDSAFWRSYTYDSLARLVEMSRKPGQIPERTAFGYDKLNRLSRVTKDRTTSREVCVRDPDTKDLICNTETTTTTDLDLTLGYDPASNLQQQTGLIGASSLTGSYSLGNRQSSWGALGFVYDADGNRASKTVGGVTTTYTWSADGKLRSVSSGTQTTHYDYNALGLLVRKRVAGDTTKNRYFIWDDGRLIAELDSRAQSRIAEYMYGPAGNRPLMMVADTGAGRTYYLERDQIGNVTGMFDATSAKQTITYDAWGKTESITSAISDTTRLRWKALPFEGGNTQLYYVKSRWYDPEARRFISEDPLGIDGGINQYSFALNNPVQGSDPSGMVPCGYDSINLTECGDPLEFPVVPGLGTVDDPILSRAKRKALAACGKGADYTEFVLTNPQSTDNSLFFCYDNKGAYLKAVVIESPELGERWRKNQQAQQAKPAENPPADPAPPKQATSQPTTAPKEWKPGLPPWMCVVGMDAIFWGTFGSLMGAKDGKTLGDKAAGVGGVGGVPLAVKGWLNECAPPPPQRTQ